MWFGDAARAERARANLVRDVWAALPADAPDLDLAILDLADPLLQFTVLQSGALLWAANAAAPLEYRIRAEGAYRDTAKYRARIHAYLTGFAPSRGDGSLSPQAEVVERKLLALAGYLDELRPQARLDLAAYRGDATVRRVAERLLQLAIEAAADACAALLGQLGQAPAPTMRAEFERVRDAGALDAELAARLAPAEGLRNRLVHDYERLDDAAVWGAAREALRDFPSFIAQIAAFSQRHGSECRGE